MYRRVSTEWASGAGILGREVSSADVGKWVLEALVLVLSNKCRLDSWELYSRSMFEREIHSRCRNLDMDLIEI
jgi:hypothetical protein